MNYAGRSFRFAGRVLSALGRRCVSAANWVEGSGASPEFRKSYTKWIKANGDQTLRLSYPLTADDVVLDIGGFEGQWASDIFSRYLPTVHIFEPVPEHARQIADRFRRNPKVHVHPFALGARNGTISMNVSGDASSAFTSDSGVLVPMRSFAEWASEAALVDVALMKVNIEGGEYDLIDHLITTGLIARVRNLQVQFHEFVPSACQRMEKLHNALEKTHVPTYQFPFVWENWAMKSVTIGSG